MAITAEGPVLRDRGCPCCDSQLFMCVLLKSIHSFVCLLVSEAGGELRRRDRKILIRHSTTVYGAQKKSKVPSECVVCGLLG